MRRSALLIVIVFLALVTAQAVHPVTAVDPTDTVTPTNTQTPDATEVAYANVVRTALQSMSIVQEVIFDEEDDARVLTITFITSASTSEDRVAEWMSILDPLAVTIHDQALDVTTITLIASNADGLVGKFTATAKDLADYYSKQLTRLQFLDQAKYVSLLPTPTITPSLSKDEAQGTLVQLQVTKTAYVSALNQTAEFLKTELAFDSQQTATWTGFNLKATQLAQTIAAPVPVRSGGGGSSSGAACPDVNLTCSRLTCAQAYACLAAGDSRIDGDHDGKPCESQCGG